MVAEDIGLRDHLHGTKVFDAVIEKGIIFLLIFTPLVFGTVHPWSISIMETAIFIVLGAWLFKMAFLREISMIKTPLSLSIPVAALAGLMIFHLMPLPEWVLKNISPSTIRIYLTFTDEETLKTISLYPGATLDSLIALISYAAVFLVVVNHYRTRKQVERIFHIIIGMGCFLAVFAVIQKLTWNGRMFWFYPLREGLSSNRSYIWGPYINHNHFAGYMEMAIPIGLGFFLYWITETDNLPGIPLRQRFMKILRSNNLLRLIFFSLSVLIMSAVLFYSLSRGGILSFSISLIFFGSLIYSRRSLRKRAKPLIMIGIIVFIMVIITGMGRIEERFREIGEQEEIPRLNIWTDSLEIIKDFPVIGTGAGTFKSVYSIYQTKHANMIFEHAENDYVETVAELGITGLLISLGLIIVFIYLAVKAWRLRRNRFVKCVVAGGISSCVAILIHGFTDFNFRIPANALLLTIIAAAVYAALHNIKSVSRENAQPGRVYRLGRHQSAVMTAVVASGLVVLLYFPVMTFSSDYYHGKAVRLLDDPNTPYQDVLPISEKTIGNYNAALKSLKKAASINPFISAYPAELGGLYAKLEKWIKIMEGISAPVPAEAVKKEEAYRNATRYIRKAVSLEPTNPWYHLSLGQLYETGNNPEMADKELKRAVISAPANIDLRYSVAIQYLLTGKSGDALEQARNIAALDTSYLPPDSIRGALMSEMMTDSYLSMIYNSYLFKALEIAWRGTRDPDVVKGITPDNPDAKKAVSLFLESKGYGYFK